MFILAPYLYEEFGESSDGRAFNIAIFIPIFAAAFIPIIAANKKKKQGLPKQHQQVLRAVVLLTVAIVIGIIIFFTFSQ